MNAESLKRCPKCGNSYPRTAEYFNRHSQKKDGLRCYCKACHLVDNKRYRDYYCAYLRQYRRQRFVNKLIAPMCLRDAGHLARTIQRMLYGDALTSGMWQLERQCLEQIKDADTGKLVVGSYADFLLYRAGKLHAVLETRQYTPEQVVALLNELAHELLRRGWQLNDTRFWQGGAQTHPETNVARVKRLLKPQRRPTKSAYNQQGKQQ